MVHLLPATLFWWNSTTLYVKKCLNHSQSHEFLNSMDADNEDIFYTSEGRW